MQLKKDGVEIEGVTLDADNNNIGNSIIAFTNARNTKLNNIECNNSSANGVWFFDNSQLTKVKDSKFLNTAFNAIFIEGESQNETDVPTTENCLAWIEGNFIDGTTSQNAIYVGHALQDTIITNNITSNVGDCSIEVGGAWGSYGVKKAIIANNLGQVTSGVNGAFIYVRRSQHVTASNNIGVENHYGIHVDSSSNVIGRGNVFINSEFSGKIYASNNVSLDYVTQNDTSKKYSFY